MAEAQAQAFASTELYMEVCCELTSEEQMCAWTLRYNTAGFPKRPHYIANFWYERVKEVLGLDQRYPCGGIWVCGLHQPRRRGEITHVRTIGFISDESKELGADHLDAVGDEA